MASGHLAGRILLEFSRSRRVLGLWIVFPVAMLLLFGWMRANDTVGLDRAFTVTAPGILVGAALFFSCLGGPISVIVSERERGTLRRLLASPMSGAQYFAGLSMAHVAIALGQCALVYGITYLVGGSFRGSLFAGFLVLTLTTGTYVGSGFIIGTRYATGADEINGTVAGIGVPLLVLGGTFFSVDLLPPAVYALAHLNPIFHMNQAFRSLASDAASMGEVWPNLAFLGVFTVGAVWMGARAYDRMLRVERES